jgi:hypothetical protein
MRSLVAIAVAAQLSGCATAWIATQALGTQRTLDEGVREVSVPAPGVQERLAVSLPLVTEYAQPAGTTAQAPTTPSTPLPFALTCRTEQRAKDVVYHSAFRYGKRWKWTSGIMALVEGGLAALMISAASSEKPGYALGGVFFAADALVTTGLFFIPRKEIYRHDERTAVTPVRSDCPEGMTLAIGGVPFPVDAAGRLGEVGDAALDAWMSAPNGPLLLEVAGQRRAFEVGQGEQCVWLRDHHRDQPASCYAGVALRSVMAAIDVPAGTLSALAP